MWFIFYCNPEKSKILLSFIRFWFISRKLSCPSFLLVTSIFSIESMRIMNARSSSTISFVLITRLAHSLHCLRYKKLFDTAGQSKLGTRGEIKVAGNSVDKSTWQPTLFRKLFSISLQTLGFELWGEVVIVFKQISAAVKDRGVTFLVESINYQVTFRYNR